MADNYEELTKNFTTSQIKAVTTLKGNLLVSASAGSGKTRVLVSRILNILLNKKAKLNELLVVTFTEAAGEEMKTRIKQDLIKNKMFDEAELLSSADITNLHKFCNKILRQYFYEVGLDPNFKILDDVESGYIKLDVLSQCIAKYSSDPQYAAVLEAFYSSRRQDSIINLILNCYNFLTSINDKANWIEDKFTNCYEVEFDENICISYIKEYVLYIQDCVKTEVENLKNELLRQDDKSKTIALLDEVFAVLQWFNKGESNTKFFNQVATPIKFPTVKVKGYEGVEFDVRQKLSSIIDLYKKNVASVREKLGEYSSAEELQNAIQKNGSFIKKLMDIVKDFSNSYKQAKRQHNSVDFSDLEEYCLEILENEEIRKTLQRKYKYIFIDEYQDTNDVQEAIISKITTGDNICMVGDVKQSIYAFRGCSPQIFINKLIVSEEDGANSTLVKLNENFRSREHILKFSNFVFDLIMNVETSQIDYKRNARFIYGQKYKSFSENVIPEVEVVLFDEVKKEKEINSFYDISKDELVKEDDDSFSEEAYKCVQIINKALKQKIYDQSIDDYRNVEYNDIAILTRKKKGRIQTLSKVLSKYNIPYSSIYDIALLKNLEVRLLLNYLKVVDNDLQDIPLVSVLTTFYDITVDDLSKIKLKFQDCEKFYDALNNYAKTETDSISKKINRFYDDIKYYRNKLRFVTVRELVEDIVVKFDYENYCLKGEDSLEKLENVNKFINFIGDRLHSLSEFLNYVEEFAIDKTVENNVITGSNAVSIMTIHKSKGLEFPVVILVDAGQDFYFMDRTKSFVLEKELGYASNYYDIEKHQEAELGLSFAIKKKIVQQQIQEEMRLLYVALTRAKNNLFVLGHCQIDKIKSLNNNLSISSTNNYLSWILGALKDYEIEQLVNSGKINILFNGCNLRFAFDGYDDFAEFEYKKQYKTKEIIDISKYDDYFNFKIEKSNILLKNTVTALQQDENHSFDITINFDSELELEEIDYLTIGTVYHLMLEKLSFENQNMSTIETEYRNIVNSNTLTDEEKSLIDFDKIKTAITELKTLINEGDKVYKEQSFYFQTNMRELGKNDDITNFFVQGVADLIIEKPDEIILVDYKTTRIKNQQKLADKYKLQLDLYAKSIEEFFNKKVAKKFIYSFYLDKLIIV